MTTTRRNKRNRGRRKLIAHARMRTEQRSGMPYADLRRHLRRGTTLNAARLSHTRVLKVAKIHGEIVWFVYSLTLKQIVTIIPPGSRMVRDAIATNKRLPGWAVKSAHTKGEANEQDGCGSPY